MNAELQEQAERDAALTAVAHALTEDEAMTLLRDVGNLYPHLHGATVADVLDCTTDHDMFLDQTEPFLERFSGQLPQDVRLSAAMHAIILLHRELTPGRVIALLQRAGMTAVPRYPEVEASLLAYANFSRDYDVNHLVLKARAEQGMRARGVPESEITEFLGSVRYTGVPGYSRNAADIAAWVTLVDRCTATPRKPYDPVDDLAVLLRQYDPDGPDGGQVAQALANLRSHLDMSTPERLGASLRAHFGREA